MNITETSTQANTTSKHKRKRKELVERIQICIPKSICDKLEAEWQDSGIAGFSTFLIFKMKQKGVFDFGDN